MVATSEYFNTDIGGLEILHNSFASVNEFSHYLANSLAWVGTSTPTDHSYTEQQTCTAIPDDLIDHNYATITQISYINLDIDYAEIVSKVSSNYNNIRNVKDEAPMVLLSRDLQIKLHQGKSMLQIKKTTAGKNVNDFAPF